jgi:hypothetical protein
MTTAAASSTTSQTNNDESHLETACLIWLDSNVNSDENRGVQQRLRSIINYFKKFNDIQQCQTYVEQQSKTDRLVLIVSGKLVRQIVARIHQLQQVVSIYVYCANKEAYIIWCRDYVKVGYTQTMNVYSLNCFCFLRSRLLSLMSMNSYRESKAIKMCR